MNPTHSLPKDSVASLPALGPWAPPAERGLSLESIYRVSLTVDLCEGNKIISLKNLLHHSQLGAPQKEKKSGDFGHVPSVPIGEDGPARTCSVPALKRNDVTMWYFLIKHQADSNAVCLM